MDELCYYVYIMTDINNTTLYIGVTSNLRRRVYEHKNKLIKGFTSKYNICKLVYFESGNSIEEAIRREKFLKGKKREYKKSLIETSNPCWNDLYNNIIGD